MNERIVQKGYINIYMYMYKAYLDLLNTMLKSLHHSSLCRNKACLFIKRVVPSPQAWPTQNSPGPDQMLTRRNVFHDINT